MESIKLQKYLAAAGIASRRKAEELIAAKKVTVNGSVAKIGDRMTPGEDQVLLEGKPVKPEEPKYYLLNKPFGYLSTAYDPEGRKTVLDLVPSSVRIYPVGRLDYDSEGLILLTNDGDLAYHYTHPKFEVEKTYHVLVNGQPSEADLNRLRKGVLLEDGRTAPAKITILENADGRSWIEVVIHEGRKRQVRRMFEHIQSPVVRLIRVRMGDLELGNLKPGAWQEISASEASKGITLTA